MNFIVTQTLPDDSTSFSQYLSEKSYRFQYEKTNSYYINKLNDIIKQDSSLQKLSLMQIISRSEGHTYNMAAQIFNHELFFNSITPNYSQMSQKIKQILQTQFQSIENFYDAFIKESNLFGSGWIWLVAKDNVIKIISTVNADIPKEVKILAVCDVWEHAYYVDYYNDRLSFVSKFIKEYINWKNVEDNFYANIQISA